MRKKMLYAFIFIVLTLSVFFNISNYMKERDRVSLFNGLVFFSLYDTKMFLAYCLHHYELDDMTSAIKSLDSAYISLIKTDVLIRSFDRNFKERYSYVAGTFEFIASCMWDYTITVNDIELNGIKKDAIITESEVAFLTRLINDLSVAIDKITDDTGRALIENLSLNKIRTVLDEFIENWRWKDPLTIENSPYPLLEHE